MHSSVVTACQTRPTNQTIMAATIIMHVEIVDAHFTHH